jgi:predicted RNase H-like nuclease (RuvC/YqgF family)
MTDLLPLCFVELFCPLRLPPYTKDVAKCSQEKSEKLKVVESGLWELQAKDQRIKEELRKNIVLRKELDKLKQERTRETWLLKNDIDNLEKSNSELQEQLKEQKKAHQGKSVPLSSTFSSNWSCVLKHYLHRRA